LLQAIAATVILASGDSREHPYRVASSSRASPKKFSTRANRPNPSLTADYARLSGLLLKYAAHFSNLQEIVGESVVAGLFGEGRLRRLCWTNADLSDLEIVIHRKLFKTYEVNSPPVSMLG
jgi:hypothetical protein